MNPYKKLFNNSVIFAIGNLGSKIISLLLVPLYTYNLSTNEFGSADILVTTTRMLLPIITLSVFDAVLRFVMDKDYENEDILTNSVIISLIGVALLMMTYPLLETLNLLEGYSLFVYTLLILQLFEAVFAQYSRAVGKLKLFSLNGILMAGVLVISNIVFLVVFKFGIKGYLLSLIISNLFSVFFLGYNLKILKIVKFNRFNRILINKMLYYSVPLIPNALLWWTMSASNRYLVLYFWGASANGLFAVAQKIPSVLSIISSIFSQSWQLSAIEEYNSKGRSNFYSKVFNNYSLLMFFVVSSILVVLKPMMKIVLSADFYLAWEVIPYLLLGSIFNSFSVFLGTNYIAAKETRGAFKTTIFGSIITIILGLILIPLIGINGAGVSILISSFIMWIIRVYDTKKFISMTIDLKIFLRCLIIIALQIVILNINFEFKIELFLEMLLFSILLILSRSSIKNILELLIKTKKTI